MDATSVAGRTQLLRNNVTVRTTSKWDNETNQQLHDIEMSLRADATRNGLDLTAANGQIVDGWL